MKADAGVQLKHSFPELRALDKNVISRAQSSGKERYFRTTRRAMWVSLVRNFDRNVTKFAPHDALKSIA
jgi:hypothetical protein